MRGGLLACRARPRRRAGIVERRPDSRGHASTSASGRAGRSGSRRSGWVVRHGVRRPDRAILGFATERATRMRTVSYIRAANGSLKRSSEWRRLAPLAIM